MRSLGKSFALVLVALFLASLVILPPANSQSQSSQITISADGSVVGTDKIRQNGNTYTLTGNLNASIIIEKDHIVFNGAGFALQGSGNLAENETAISITERTNITIENLKITGFNVDIELYNSSNCIISGNKIYGSNSQGILLINSRNNWIKQNNVETTQDYGVNLFFSSGNFVSKNSIENNAGAGINIYGLPYLDFLNGSNNIISGNMLENNSLYGDGSTDPGDISIHASNNTIIGNNINNSYGILLFLNDASWNFFSKNYIFNCRTAVGIIDAGSNNTFFENNIIGNNVVVLYDYVLDITFYRNNFINNTAMEGNYTYSSIGSPNWDNGTQGNFYSDYLTKYPAAKEIDSTGTYDTPYAIPLYDTYLVPHTYLFYDNHPLISPVEISQNITELPSWITPPTLTTNQVIPTFYLTIVLIVIISVLLVSLLLYVRLQKRH